MTFNEEELEEAVIHDLDHLEELEIEPGDIMMQLFEILGMGGAWRKYRVVEKEYGNGNA